jgi:2,3-bisphosphoglycerate-independent phosphoglycerate mutase
MSKIAKSLQTKDRPPLVLTILDGWGLAQPGPYNAVSQAKTPVFDRLWSQYPRSKLYAHGKHVGLPERQVGNSEAGHLNIGAGRIVKQDAVYIFNAISDGTFFKNPAFLEAIHHAEQYKAKLHVMGILSGSQCPHMSPEHVIALARLAERHKVRVLLHFFTDGRDAPPQAALSLWRELESKLPAKSCVVASVTGRLYLDRKKKWERTEKIYQLLVLGQAQYQARSLEAALGHAYKRGENDEFIKPTLIRNKQVTSQDNFSDNDSIIFFNLRSDRARQLTKPFVQEDFEALNQGAFTRTKVLRNIKFVAMTDFGPDLGPVLTAFPSRDVQRSLPMVLGRYYKQLYISEMEKYAHVTYFLNGGYKEPVASEDRVLVKSQDVDSYAQTPAMSTMDITKVVVESLKNKWYNFVCMNFCNADMLGHTGNAAAALQGLAMADQCLGKVLSQVKSQHGELIVVADHGNAENMGTLTPKGELVVNTMHTTNLVPFIIFTDKRIKLKTIGKLGDIAPTMLDLVGIRKPKEMTGKSLI